jgi:intraflagellar transport protein 81
VSEFLKVLAYQSTFDTNWENGLINGDRKVIYPIYYYLLVNLELHKKRAYLAKYLVPLDIPADYAGDPEIKKLNEQYRELQAEFQVTHENFEVLNKASLVTI